MKLFPSSLAALVLLSALRVGAAEGAIIIGSKTKKEANGKYYRQVTVVVDGEDAAPVVGVELGVHSDAGREDVTLVESDTRLHGGAALAALPVSDASLTFTLYDEASAPLVTFAGTLGADGAVTLAAKETGEVVCDKTGCTTVEPWDIELRAAEVFSAEKGYELTVDLGGADAADIAYGALTIVDGCADGARTCGTTTTKAEMEWDSLGAVWEGVLAVEHEGILDADVTLYGVDGKKLPTHTRVRISPTVHFVDDWQGETAYRLPTSHDPLTTVAIHDRWGGGDDADTKPWEWTGSRRILTVLSDGWTAATAPAEAEVELDGGEVLTIPANSYQRTGSATARKHGGIFVAKLDYQTTSEDVGLYPKVGGPPACGAGVCLALTDAGERGTELSVTSYGTSAAALPDTVTVALTGDDGIEEIVKVPLEDEVAVAFAHAIGFARDPVGVELGGQVNLLAAPDARRGKAVVSKGAFDGALCRGEERRIALCCVDRRASAPEGDIVVGAASIELERTDTDGDGVIAGPPVIVLLTTIDGTGTRAVASVDR